MRKFSLTILLCLLTLPVHADNRAAVPSYIAAAIPQARMAGQGRMTYMMMDIYDAELFTPNGTWREGEPVALSLTYLRHLRGIRIADRSAEEMRKQGFTDEMKLAAWHSQMAAIFPDVEDGTNVTGILTPEGETVFYRDGRDIGRIADAEFGKRFFDIWLSARTSEPELRTELLGHTYSQAHN